MKSNSSLIYSLCLVAGDFLALVAAFVVAYVVRVKFAVGIDPTPIVSNGRLFLSVFLAVLPFWILIFAFMGLYNHNIYEKRFKELGRLFVGSFFGLLLVIFWDFLSTQPIFPARLVPIYGFVFAFVFLVVFRNLSRFIRVQMFKHNAGLTRVLLVGNTAMTLELLDWLSNSRKSGYKVVGVVGGKKSIGTHENIDLYRSFHEFSTTYKGTLHGIIQTELYADEARNAEILTSAQENHISYRFVPGNTELFVGNIEVELFRSSIPVIAVHQTALFGWGRVVKRLFDLIVGTILLVLSLPLMAIIWFIILFDHGDPIWRNLRLSRYGTKIQMYKFRTQLHAYHRMTPEAGFAKMGRPELAKKYRENGDFLEDDPRISKIGHFLRKTSLDELPQLFNVLKGDMSLVGPRPLEPFELSGFDKKNLMLSVKTGVTGLAAVSGRRDISFEERRALDLYYVQNWSLWLDLVILAKTVRTVVKARGAK
ncbi:MAG TPA: exopolysaccharide biosynthesis polyprenyl glycosylphosphotransferase [Candidatus Saccharimonadales bacterium]|nr:exopolysaccharide biosynthesis polyprenyl glycosylphosphotransferase [Candidatus Saccharimonadales bacterium]